MLGEYGYWALYNGSTFKGHQKTSKCTYPVEVELKHSFLCGYLKIRDLTEDYPELTTYFESEIIGSKYSFLTRKWEATESVDRAHWCQFPAFAPYETKFTQPNFHPDFSDSDYLFMRWKELFLVPDHKVTNIRDASFAGFYYICFCKSKGTFSGYYYYHKISEKYYWLLHH